MLDESRTRIQIIALRVAADLLALSLSAESTEMPEMSIRNLIADEPTLHEAVFDTAGDFDHLDLDLFDRSVFAALVNEVRTLLVRADYRPVPFATLGQRVRRRLAGRSEGSA